MSTTFPVQAFPHSFTFGMVPYARIVEKGFTCAQESVEDLVRKSTLSCKKQ